MPAPIDVPLAIFDASKTIDQQDGPINEGYIDQDGGQILTKQDAQSFDTGMLANGGRAVITEVRSRGYGFAEDQILIDQMLENDEAGDGRFSMPVVDSTIANDDDANRAAGQALALRVGDPTKPLSERVKGGFEFDSFSDQCDIGKVQPFVDTEDDVNDEFPIIEVTFTIIGAQLNRHVKCQKQVDKSIPQIAIDAFRTSKSPTPKRRIDNIPE